jgi:hypothetical protein
MRSNEPRTLPDWIEQGYQILSAEIIDSSREGIPRDRAREQLLAHGEFPNDPADAEYAIDRLLNSKWLYEVDGSLRITDPDLKPNES